MRLIVLLALVWLSGTVSSSNSSLNEYERLAYDLLKEFVETDTTHSSGDTLALANAIANRLKDEGLPKADVHVIEYGGKGNVVARLRSDKPAFKPLLLLAHLDVVEAKREDWTMDPKKLTEEEGYFYGRGVLDVKNEVAIHLTNFLRFHREKDSTTRKYNMSCLFK